MSKTLDTVLLLALPASGKSEVRRYLARLDKNTCVDDFHLGPTVQLDDFPYVHMMRRIDEELRKLEAESIFFHANDKPFKDPRDWGTLVQLVNEDYVDLRKRPRLAPKSAAAWLFERLDAARTQVGAPASLNALSTAIKKRLGKALDAECEQMVLDKRRNFPPSLTGRTVVIEFARGGPHDSKMPLPSPFGYAYSLSQLSPRVLERACILYVWVTPEESRRKNEARTDPNDPGSILHHGVPIDVMMNDYGCDDMEFLLESSGRPQHVRVESGGKTFYLPTARFDNRVDKTSFVRGEPSEWKKEDVAALHQGLKGALDQLFLLTHR